MLGRLLPRFVVNLFAGSSESHPPSSLVKEKKSTAVIEAHQEMKADGDTALPPKPEENAIEKLNFLDNELKRLLSEANALIALQAELGERRKKIRVLQEDFSHKVSSDPLTLTKPIEKVVKDFSDLVEVIEEREKPLIADLLKTAAEAKDSDTMLNLIDVADDLINDLKKALTEVNDFIQTARKAKQDLKHILYATFNILLSALLKVESILPPPATSDKDDGKILIGLLTQERPGKKAPLAELFSFLQETEGNLNRALQSVDRFIAEKEKLKPKSDELKTEAKTEAIPIHGADGNSAMRNEKKEVADLPKEETHSSPSKILCSLKPLKKGEKFATDTPKTEEASPVDKFETVDSSTSDTVKTSTSMLDPIKPKAVEFDPPDFGGLDLTPEDDDYDRTAGVILHGVTPKSPSSTKSGMFSFHYTVDQSHDHGGLEVGQDLSSSAPSPSHFK